MPCGVGVSAESPPHHDVASIEFLEAVLGKEGRHEHEDDAGTQIPGVDHDGPWMSSRRITANVSEPHRG